MPDTVLVADDEELFRLCLCAHLERSGYRTISAGTGEEALALVAERRPDIVLMDFEMPMMDGLTALRQIRQTHKRTPVVLMTAHGRVEAAIKAARAGARAFLTKPFDLRDASQTVERILSEERARKTTTVVRAESGAFDGLVGNSIAAQNARAALTRAAIADPPTLLVEGPAGTGKSLAAALFHRAGPRHDGAFIEFDCGSISDDTIEEALFGRWSNDNTRRGAIESAAGGTLVLDDVSALSHRGQSLLLNVLERRTFRRVGGIVDVPITCTIVATSRRALRAESRAERFREGLYYRLALVTVSLPALSTRTEDLEALVPHLVERCGRELGRPARGASPATLSTLANHSWPGNVRELRSVLERAVLLNAGGLIEPADLPGEVRGDEPEAEDICPFDLPAGGVTMATVERGLLMQALARTRGNERAAAALLGLSPMALRERMLKAGVRPSDAAGRSAGADVIAIDRDFAESPEDARTFVPMRERA
jgi:two-component system response regulator AtoC